MGTLSKLAGQTAVYGLSTVLVRFLNFLLTPYLTYYAMAPSTYGIYSYMYSLIPFALVVLTMGLESGYFRFSGKAQDETEKRRVFSTAWGGVTAAAGIFMVLTALFINPLTSALSSSTGYAFPRSYILLVGAIITLDAITAIPFARLREQGRSGRYVAVRLFSVIINIGLCLFFYSALPWLAAKGILAGLYSPEFGAGYAFVANLVASAAVLFILLPTCGGIKPRIEGKMFRSMMVYSAPLLVSGVAGTANEFIDRQMIAWLTPATDSMASVGIYSAVLKLAVVMTLFVQMYRLAAEPFFLADFKKEDFRTTNAAAMKYFIIVTIFIFLVITLFADFFLLLLGRDFREGGFILPLVLLSNMLAGIVLNLSFWYKQSGATKYAIYITGAGLLVTVGLNIALIPRMGYYGAAVTRLICEAAMVAVSYLLCRKHYPIPYDFRRIGEYVLIGAVLYGAGLLAGGLERLPRYLIDTALCAIFVVYAVWREKINLRTMLKSVKTRKS